MNENQLNYLLSKHFSKEASEKCLIQYEIMTKSNPENSFEIKTDLDEETLSHVSKSVICVSGIYLPMFAASSNRTSKLHEVESTKNNLRKIALGIASNKAVSLEGPVGSGKTCLVEYLAGKTGRVLGESFIKVQLGDQTDCKMLLGTYRCTDIPGEFVWQPGVLTQVRFLLEIHKFPNWKRVDRSGKCFSYARIKHRFAAFFDTIPIRKFNF